MAEDEIVLQGDPLQETHDAIAEMAKAVFIGKVQLAGMILGACPGPHRYVQHRDRRPPWCKACRYTETGERVPQGGRRDR